MIIDIGTEVDESVIRWKRKETDEWQRADIDELIHLYESVVHCKDCRHYQSITDGYGLCRKRQTILTTQREDDFCSYGERSEP